MLTVCVILCPHVQNQRCNALLRPTSAAQWCHDAAQHSPVNGSISAAGPSSCRTNAEPCTLVDLDLWFPKHSLTPRELERKWRDWVHPSPFGYDEIGLIVYQHLQHILPQS